MTTFLPAPQMMAGFSSGTSGNLPMEVGSLCKRWLDCVEEFDVRFIADPVYDLSSLGRSAIKGEETHMGT